MGAPRLAPIGLALAVLGALAPPGRSVEAGITGCPQDRLVVERVAPGTAAPALCVVQDRAARESALLILDAVAENVSTRPMDRIQVGVELYDYFTQLLSADSTVLQPVALEPGQSGSLRVVTPFREAIRKVRYRFTWVQDGRQHQATLERSIAVR